MSRIFISYRRDDSAGYVGHLREKLGQHFGEDSVFRDIDTIEPGEDFVEVIEKAVGSCEVLLAMIGKHWLTVSDSQGQRRLDNQDDLVRLEIANALDRNIRVIPVLVGGAAMPSAAHLPENLKRLAHRNAQELSDRNFQRDVAQLIEVIEKVLGTAPQAQHKSNPLSGLKKSIGEALSPVSTEPESLEETSDIEVFEVGVKSTRLDLAEGEQVINVISVVYQKPLLSLSDDEYGELIVTTSRLVFLRSGRDNPEIDISLNEILLFEKKRKYVWYPSVDIKTTSGKTYSFYHSDDIVADFKTDKGQREIMASIKQAKGMA